MTASRSSSTAPTASSALTKKQIEQIFTGEITDWSAVGGKPGAISIYTRNTSSGTYSDFKGMAMSEKDYAGTAQKMAGNEEIASEVGKNPNGVGYVGMAYLKAAGIKAVAVNGVKPTIATVRNHSYPHLPLDLLLHERRARRRSEGVPRFHHQPCRPEDRAGSRFRAPQIISLTAR